MEYLSLVMLIPLTKLMVDDFRSREVSLVWLVLFVVSTTGISVVLDGLSATLTRSGLNLLLVAYMGAGVLVWTWIKAHKFINPVNKYLGLGDVLFFLALAPLFPLKRFAYLLVACMVFSLVWWLVVRTAGKAPKNIPLVATSGIVTSITIILNIFLR